MTMLLKCGSDRLISMEKTGKNLESLMQRKGYTVRDIQQQLHLSCPQPVYRWLRGKMLPSVDHLYILARLFGMHMEDLLVPECEIIGAVFDPEGTWKDKEMRLRMYGNYME